MSLEEFPPAPFGGALCAGTSVPLDFVASLFAANSEAHTIQRHVGPSGSAPPKGAGGESLKLAFVVPWRDEGRWIWESLQEGRCQADLVLAAPDKGSLFDRQRLPPYISELVHLMRRRAVLDDYDVIFAWELRTALAVAMVQDKKQRAKIIPVGPILKGPALRMLPLIRWLFRDVNRIVCFSRAECDTQARLLGLPRERFLFVPTPWKEDKGTVVPEESNYILALGHSGRDYPTLLEAVRGTELPVILVARSPHDLEGAELPPNVTARWNTQSAETNALVAGATLGVVPLHSTDYSAGQTVLLRMMARGKAVIVTDTPGIRDYVQDNKTAVLVPPGNVDELRTTLLRLWDDARERDRIGLAAEKAAQEEFGFPQFAERMVAIAEELVCAGKASGR